MKLNLDIPTHIKRFEVELNKDTTTIAMCAKPGGNHIRVERSLTNTKIIFDNTYMQYVVNELAEALR